MKIKRFFCVFLLLALLVSLFASPQACALDNPEIQAEAALLIDPETGAIAYAKNEHQALYPAGLTKVMTALLVLEAVENGALSMDTELTASSSALAGLTIDGGISGIKKGEVLSVRSLLYFAMVISSNEACHILAEGVSGSVSAFVDAMNTRATDLGCMNTHFANPTGIHHAQQYSSAWDLYLITRAAMDYPDFMTICDTATTTIPATNLTKERVLYTTNHLLSSWRVIGYRNRDAHGIATGSTDEAGYCLISSSSRNNITLLSIILGAERIVEDGTADIKSFSETSRLLKWGFNSYSYRVILEAKEPIQEVTVALSKTDHVAVHPTHDVEVLFPKDLRPEDLERTVTLNEPVSAPVSKGQILGTLSVSHEGTVYATVDLLALNDVEADRLMVFFQQVQTFFSSRVVQLTLAVILLLIVVLLLSRKLHLRRRRRYGSSPSSRRYSSGYRGRKRR